ncbi:hypothetical protein [Megalodesulfovibrio paquesii]
MRTAIAIILLTFLLLPGTLHAGSYRVQLGLYRQESAAVDGWQLLKSHFPELLEGHLPELEPVQTGAGTLLRLNVVVDDEATARTIELAIAGAPQDAMVAERQHPPALSSNGHFKVTAGAVPGQPNTSFVFGQDRVYVGLRADNGRVALTPGVATTSAGDTGPYAGLEFKW